LLRQRILYPRTLLSELLIYLVSLCNAVGSLVGKEMLLLFFCLKQMILLTPLFIEVLAPVPKILDPGWAVR
jgi:hypothetical protein